MSGYPTLVEFVFRFFSHRKRTEVAGAATSLTSPDVSEGRRGAQPVCHLLDHAEDIAEVYSRTSSQGREILRKESTNSKRDGAHPAPESSLLAIECDCCERLPRIAVGVCRHCEMAVCVVGLKSDECYRNGKHEVRAQ